MNPQPVNYVGVAVGLLTVGIGLNYFCKEIKVYAIDAYTKGLGLIIIGLVWIAISITAARGG